MNNLKMLLMLIITSLTLQGCGSYMIAEVITDQVRRDWDETDFGVIDGKLRDKDIYLGAFEYQSSLIGRTSSAVPCYKLPDALESRCYYITTDFTVRQTERHKEIEPGGILIEGIQNDKKAYYSFNHKITITDTTTNAVLDEWVTPYMETDDLVIYMEEYFELLYDKIK